MNEEKERRKGKSPTFKPENTAIFKQLLDILSYLEHFVTSKNEYSQEEFLKEVTAEFKKLQPADTQVVTICQIQLQDFSSTKDEVLSHLHDLENFVTPIESKFAKLQAKKEKLWRNLDELQRSIRS